MNKLQSCLICLVVTLLGAQAAPTELTGEVSNVELQSSADSAAPNPYQELLLNEYRSACLKMSGSEAGYLKTVSAFRPATMCFVESDGVAEFMLAIRQNGSTKEERTAIIDR
ncbi:hypothetical protein pipiens_003443 [Culex pipiens pipiens]|uniref:Uncharacterized protein n=1 Tax=Culex pipiens pipiens TaxID=38569 RepID=A0ABD1CXV6_CULPP